MSEFIDFVLWFTPLLYCSCILNDRG